MAGSECKYLEWVSKNGVKYIYCKSNTCTDPGLSAPYASQKDEDYGRQDCDLAKNFCTNGGTTPGLFYKWCKHYKR